MIRAALLFLLALALPWATTAQAQDQTQTQNQPPQFQLVPADTLSVDSHLILTVPLADLAQLPAVSAAIQNRYGVTLSAEWPLRSISVHCFVMTPATDADLDDLIARMRTDPEIRTVQRVQGFATLSNDYSDPLLPAQTALEQMNVLPAQKLTKAAGVTVGIIDSRIKATHPDLAGRVSDAKDFVGNTNAATGEAHGTAMAGIIAADANNAVGMVGIAPQARIVDLRACWQTSTATGQCNSFSLARALNFAILQKVKVLNMSLGGPPDPLLDELVRAAIKQGSIVIAARGEQADLAFPASVPGVLPAGPSGISDAIPAPSVDVLTTSANDDYRYVSGSSVATAHVSGVVALIVALAPELSASEVETALRSSVSPWGEGTMLDTCKAIRIATGLDAKCGRQGD